MPAGHFVANGRPHSLGAFIWSWITNGEPSIDSKTFNLSILDGRLHRHDSWRQGVVALEKESSYLGRQARLVKKLASSTKVTWVVLPVPPIRQGRMRPKSIHVHKARDINQDSSLSISDRRR